MRGGEEGGAAHNIILLAGTHRGGGAGQHLSPRSLGAGDWGRGRGLHQGRAGILVSRDNSGSGYTLTWTASND